MRSRKIRMTEAQMERLIRDVRAVPAESIGDHLSDEAFISYAMASLTTDKEQRIDDHLASCPACADAMEHLLETSEAWRGERGAQRLAALKARMEAAVAATPSVWARVAALLRDLILVPDVALSPARGAAPLLVDGQTEDGTLHWRIVEGAEGSLTVRFSSHLTGLQGGRLRLRLLTREWQRDVTLEMVAPDEVGAEVVITRQERAQWPAYAALTVEPLSPDAEARSPDSAD